jgi:signal peptidase II
MGEPQPRRALGGRLLVTGLVAAAVIVADQLTTSWAIRRLTQGSVHVIGPLDLAITVNHGSAFGLAQGWTPVVAGLAIVLVAALLVAAGRARSMGVSVALGLLVGGAVGNLIDRVARGYHGGVVDFIELHFWPTFNVADACITVGAILLAVLLWRGGTEHRTGDRGPGERQSGERPGAASDPPGASP